MSDIDEVKTEQPSVEAKANECDQETPQNNVKEPNVELADVSTENQDSVHENPQIIAESQTTSNSQTTNNESQTPKETTTPSAPTTTVTEKKIQTPKSYKPDSKRWIILAICLSFTNAWVWITFSPISSLCVEYYNVSYSFINWLSMSYMVAFIVGVYPGGIAVDSLGLRIGINIGAFMNFIGSVTRVISATSRLSVLLMIGQWTCAFAQIFILGIPPKLSSVWFPSHERAKATTIGALANQMGIGFGFIISPLIVKKVHEKVIGMEALLIFQSFVSFLIFFTTVIFVEKKPVRPPSGSEETKGFPNEGNYLQRFWKNSLRPLINKDYFVLCVGFGIAVGSFYAVTTLLDQFLNPLGYESTFSGVIGLTIIIGGVVSCLIALLFSIKYQNIILTIGRFYKWMLKLTFVFLTITQIWLMFSLNPGSHAFLLVGAFFFGFFGTLVLPLCFELAVECTYPSGEAVSSNILMGSCQLFGIILINALDFLIHQTRIYLLWRPLSMWILTFLISIGSFIVMFFTSKLKRKEAEKTQAQKISK